MITALGQNECRDLLRKQRIGRLGCCLDNQPYVIPVNYLFDGEDLYVHSLPGRKIETLRANPQACLQVDEIENNYNWRSVLAFGEYEEITDQDAREECLSRLFAHLPHLTPVESRMTKGLAETIVFRLRVREITGVGESWR
ncbi:MAG: pyridoxamine 5'-phosphate oxidase family protein [Blastocatellia bacterium]